MLVLLRLLTVHFIADFVFQTDRMAQNKSKRWDWLFAHVAAYSASFLLYGWRFAAITFVLHFAQDAVTSRITSSLWFFKRDDGIWTQAEYTEPKHGRTIVNPWSPIDGRRHWFFVVIGLDQLLHAYALAFTWWLVFTRFR